MEEILQNLNPSQFGMDQSSSPSSINGNEEDKENSISINNGWAQSNHLIQKLPFEQ